MCYGNDLLCGAAGARDGTTRGYGGDVTASNDPIYVFVKSFHNWKETNGMMEILIDAKIDFQRTILRSKDADLSF